MATCLFNFAPARASTQDFTIESFDSNYLITKDADNVSEAYVREGIVAVFPDYDQNHGILRALPESYQGHSLELKIDMVVDEQRNPYQYETYSENGNTVIKIGDPDKYVHGTVKYFIDYHMRGVINKQADHDEFYWNINGTQWEQPFGKVSARVHVDDSLRGNVDPTTILKQTECQTGFLGSTDRNCIATPDDSGVTFETTTGLYPGENLSVVMAFNKDTFAPYTPSRGYIIEQAFKIASYVLPGLIALLIVLRNYFKFGRDPKFMHTIVPEYLPPKDESVLNSSMVVRERADNKAIPATVVDLAVRHYVKIYEVKDKPDAKTPSDYKVELIKAPDGLKPEELAVVDMLFGAAPKVGNWVELKDLKNKAYLRIAKIDSMVDENVTTKGYFRVSPRKARRPYLIWGGVLLLVGVFVFGFASGLIPAGVILLIASPAMPARTAKGVELRQYLLGLHEYMKLAEAERLKVLQSPHGELTEKVNIDDKHALVKLYERLLPYAILFGIEKDWAKEMATLYETEQPDWYSSHGAFQAAYFASSISSFNTASATNFAAPSSSSGGSGFGGGSGGGGGGGGGGGW